MIGIVIRGLAERVELVRAPEMRGQPFHKLGGRFRPVELFEFRGEANLHEVLKQIFYLGSGEGSEIRQLFFPRFALGGKLVIAVDQFAEQAGHKAEGQLLQRRKIAGDQFPRFGRVASELLRLEIAWKHGCYNSSPMALPCDKDAEKPSIDPTVGTRSVESIARSKTTPSRMPGPAASIHVVRERASPVRWCWKPFPPASSSASRPKSGRMNMVVLPAYSGSLWIVFHKSEQRRSVRRIPS